MQGTRSSGARRSRFCAHVLTLRRWRRDEFEAEEDDLEEGQAEVMWGDGSVTLVHRDQLRVRHVRCPSRSPLTLDTARPGPGPHADRGTDRGALR